MRENMGLYSRKRLNNITISTSDPDGPGIVAYCLQRPMLQGIVKKETPSCPYNDGVACSDHKCAKCGFRKEVTL